MTLPPLPSRPHFVAMAGFGRRGWLVVLGGQLALVAVVGAAVALLPDAVRSDLGPVFMLIGVALYFVWLAVALRGRPIPLDVEPGRLVVGLRGGEAYPLYGAALGLWRVAQVGVVCGTVLHLSSGSRSLRLGGRDHRPAPGTPLSAPVAEDVDAYLPAVDFEALLGALAQAGFAPAHADPRAFTSATAELALLPNRTAGRGLLSLMAPWLGTLAVLTALGPLLGLAGLGETPVGRAVMGGIAIAVIVAGLGLTIARSLRHAPALTLRLEGNTLTLVEPADRRVLSTAALHATRAQTLRHRIRTRGGALQIPTLSVQLPGRPMLTIGLYDGRFDWLGDAPLTGAPRYLVGAPDWLVLTQALGVGARLTQQPD